MKRTKICTTCKIEKSLSKFRKDKSRKTGLYPICKNKEIRKNNKGNIRALSVDHNHKTGKVRALLCGTCNQTLGIFNENINVLKKMIKYLIKYE